MGFLFGLGGKFLTEGIEVVLGFVDVELAGVGVDDEGVLLDGIGVALLDLEGVAETELGGDNGEGSFLGVGVGMTLDDEVIAVAGGFEVVGRDVDGSQLEVGFPGGFGIGKAFDVCQEVVPGVVELSGVDIVV